MNKRKKEKRKNCVFFLQFNKCTAEIRTKVGILVNLILFIYVMFKSGNYHRLRIIIERKNVYSLRPTYWSYWKLYEKVRAANEEKNIITLRFFLYLITYIVWKRKKWKWFNMWWEKWILNQMVRITKWNAFLKWY